MLSYQVKPLPRCIKPVMHATRLGEYSATRTVACKQCGGFSVVGSVWWIQCNTVQPKRCGSWHVHVRLVAAPRLEPGHAHRHDGRVAKACTCTLFRITPSVCTRFVIVYGMRMEGHARQAKPTHTSINVTSDTCHVNQVSEPGVKGVKGTVPSGVICVNLTTCSPQMFRSVIRSTRGPCCHTCPGQPLES